MYDNNTISAQGELINDTPLGIDQVNPKNGLDLKTMKIDVDKLDNTEALYPYGPTGKVFTNEVVPKSVYRILDDNYHPEFDPEYNAILLSKEQTNAGKFVAALNQAVVGEIGAGTIEGLSYLLDIPMMIDLAEGTEQEFGNAFTDFAKNLRAGVEKISPIYTDPTAPKFNPTSFEWWMKNAPSVASSISLALPAMGGAKALSMVGKLAGFAKEAGTLGKYSKLFTTATGQAIMSRHMESLMEAQGVYDQGLNDAKQKLYQKYAPQIDAEVKALPITTPVDPERGVVPGQYTEEMRQADMNKIKNKWESLISEEATKVAAAGAANTYSKNWVMLLQDIPEYMLLGRFLKPGAKTIAAEAAEKSAKVAERVGMSMPKFYTSKVAKQLGNMAGEGFEESYQFLVSQQSARMIQNLDNPDYKDSLLETLGKDYDNGDLWTNTFFGAIGAGVMQATMAGLNAKAFSESANARIKNINTWSTLMNKLHSDYVAAEELGDEALKKAVIQNFVAATGLKSIELNNKEHLLNMIDALASGDENVLSNYEMASDTRSFMKDNSNIAQELKNSIESIDKKYKDAMSNVTAQGVDPKQARSIARSMAHANHMLEYLNGELGKAEQKLSDTQVVGYTIPTPENDVLSPEGKQIFAARHEKAILNKKIAQTEKRIANPKATDNEKAALEKVKGRLQDRVKNIDNTIKEISKSETLTKEQKAVNNKLLGSEKKPGVIPQSDVDSYLSAQDAVESYKAAIEEFKDQLDEARQAAVELGKKKPAAEPVKTTVPTDEDESDLQVGGLVNFKDPETGVIKTGTVEDIEYAQKDTEGNTQVPTQENGDNVVTIKDHETGKLVHTFGLNVTPASKEQLEEAESGLAEDDTDDWDSWFETNYPDAVSKRDEYRRKTNSHKGQQTDTERGIMEFVSYTQYEDLSKEEKAELRKAGKLPKLEVRDNKFNKFVSNPVNQKYLAEATAQYTIDKTNKAFKDKLTDYRKNKVMPSSLLDKLDAWIKDEVKLTSEDIKTLLTHVAFFGELPISVKVTVNGKSFNDGMYLHTLSKNLGSLSNKELHRAYKDLRQSVVKHLLNGESIYTKGLETNRGNPININKELPQNKRKNNVSEVLGTKPAETELFVLKSSTRLSKNTRGKNNLPVSGEYENPVLVKSNQDSHPIDHEFASTGSVFAKTELTVNGKPFAVKLNKSFVSEDHAKIIFNAFSTLAKTEVESKTGKIKPKAKIRDRVGLYATKLNPAVKDELNEGMVWNISSGELLDLLIVHGEELTDPDSSRYTNINDLKRMTPEHKLALKNKRVFLKRGYDQNGNINAVYLCFGQTATQYPISTSVPGETKMVDYNMINLTENITDKDTEKSKAYWAGMQNFIKWITTNKTYAVHLENKTLNQKLNGSFLQGRSFRIGKKGIKAMPKDMSGKRYYYEVDNEIVREPNESYASFLIRNGFVTTDLERDKDGLLFDTPFVRLGFDRTKKDFGILKGEPNVADTKVATKVETGEMAPKSTETATTATKTKKRTTTTTKGKKSVKDVLNGDSVNLRERKQSVRKPYDRQDLEAEMAWVRKKLNIKENEVQIEKRLSNMMVGGKRAWGIYSSAAIKLYEQAEQGTIYHEGFHRVSLGYFTKEEREGLYRSARQLYNMPKDQYTDTQVEEKLAEEFRVFVISKGKESQPSIIKRVFQELVDFIKAVFYRVTGKGLNHGDVQRLFNQVYSGRFRFSKIRSENLGVEPRLREIMGQNYDTISSYKDVTDVTKYLTKKLLAVNKVYNLNHVKRIEWKPLVDSLNTTIEDLQDIINDPESSEQEVNTALKAQSVLKDVLGEKDSKGDYPKFNTFRYQITKMLRSMNILHSNTKLIDEDSDDFYDDIDDSEKSSKGSAYNNVDYFKPIKDNALANVKFIVNTLHESEDVNESLGLIGFANGSKVWAKLLNDIIKHDNIYDMINEIKSIGEAEDYYPYIELASILERASENLQTQFQVTFEAHKHEFVNASVHFLGEDSGVNITFDDAAHGELKRNTANKWSEFIFYDNNIIELNRVETEGSAIRIKSINKEFFNDLAVAYREQVEDYYNTVSKNGRNELTEEELESLFDRMSKLLNRMHIGVSPDVVRRYTHNIDPERKLQDNLSTAMSNILDVLSVETIVEDDKPKSATKNQHVLGLAEAYADVNTHEEGGMVLGPDGASFYKYARLNHATDSLRKIKRGQTWAEEKLSRVYNKHSKIMNSFVAQDDSVQAAAMARNNRSKFNLVTLNSFKTTRRGDSGREYLKINTIEDYLLKANAILNGHLLPFPIIANRQTYYFIKGVDLLGVEEGSNVITNSLPDGTVQFTDEVIDLFYGYYLDEKTRIRLAKKELAKYKEDLATLEASKKQPNADIKQIEKEIRALKHRLIRNYHYAGNYNFDRGNAYHFIHFKGFEKFTTPEQVRAQINKVLNDRLKDDINFAYRQQIIGKSSENGELYLYSKLFDSRLVDNLKDLNKPQNFAVLSLLSKVMINTQMGILESEKMFLGDPALFKRNKRGNISDSEFDVYDDVYKRWFGVGSTGTKLRTKYNNRGTTYNVSTFVTQDFASKALPELKEKHTQLYEKMLLNRLNKEESKNETIKTNIRKDAEGLAEARLKKFEKVDPTDGSAFISPEMYKEIVTRLEGWDDRKEKAYRLLQSNKELSAEEIISASNIVFNPLKTMYMGNHNFNGVDLLIYDKMAMFTLFRQHVKGTHLEEVLDRMEAKGKYEGQSKIHVYNFDTAVKVGSLAAVKLFENPTTRDKVADLSESMIFEQSFESLRHQQVTDPHEAARQNFGTAGLKIGMADIDQESPYGNFKTGKDLLEAINEARVAISDFGSHKVNAKFGIYKGRVSNQVFINMLSQSAEAANKSQDFIDALKTDESGNKYLELDAFPDRRWIYSTIKTIVDDATIKLSTPGNQLIQMSDYGMSKGNYKSELKMTRSSIGDSNVYAMECRVSERLFRPFFPAGHKITLEDINNIINSDTFIFGYRVPTQGQNSIMRLKVVDILPEQVGDIIQLPLEFTALTGSDFDIDKLYVALYNYDQVFENGTFKGLSKVAFKDDSNSTVEDRYKDKVVELFGVYRHNRAIFDSAFVASYFNDYVEGFGDSEIEQRIKEQNEEYEEEIQLLENQQESIIAELKATKKPARDPYVISKNIDLARVNTRLEEIKESVLNMPLQLKISKKLAEQDFEILKGLLIKAEVLPTFEEFAKLPLSHQNTNAANGNRLLDGLFTVLSDEKHFINMTTPLGSLTDILESKSAFYDNKYSARPSKSSPALFTTTPSFQSYTKEKFSASVFGIAPYALNNNHHALTQMAKVEMLSAIDFGNNPDKKKVPLHGMIGLDNWPITSWISALIDINVDGVNKPTAAPLNINEATHDVINFMIRAGAGEPTFDFIASPALKEYTANFFKATQKGKKGTTITSVESENPLQDTLTFYAETARDAKYFTEEELNNFRDRLLISLPDLLDVKKLQADADGLLDISKRDRAWYHRQISILLHFGDLRADADLLRNFVLASRVDTGKYGSNPVEILYFIKSIENIMGLHKKDGSRFTNIEKILTADKDYKYKPGDTFLPSLIKNGIFKIYDVLKYDSIYSSQGFIRLLEELVSVSAQGDYNRMGTLNTLSEELVTYFLGKFFADPVNGFGMDFNKLSDLIFEFNNNSFYELIVKLKNDKTHPLYEDVKNNAFLESIVVDFSDNVLKDKDDNPLKYTYIKTLFRSLKDDLETNELVDAFKSIIYSDKKQLRDLGVFLYLYSFYTSGFRNKRFSYANWMPLALNREFEYEGRVISLNNYLRQLIKKLNTPTGYLEFVQDVKRDIALNTASVNNIVPRIKHTDISDVYETKEGETFAIKVNYADNKSLWIGNNSNKHHLFMPHLIDEDTNITYEYVGYDMADNDPYYVAVSNKGFGNKGIMLHEYGIINKLGVIRSIIRTNNPIKEFLTIDKAVEILKTQLEGINTFQRVLWVDQISTEKPNLLSVFGTVDQAAEMREQQAIEDKEAADNKKKMLEQRKLYSTYDLEVVSRANSNLKQSINNKTTVDQPIYIDVDGSSKGLQSEGTATLGTGAYAKLHDKEYFMRASNEDIRKYFETQKIEIAKNANNEVAELMALLSVLNAFRNSSEHLYITQDYNGAVMYFLKNGVNPNEAFKNSPNKEWQPDEKKRPDIAFLVNNIRLRINEIENNGGSVKIKWLSTKSTPEARVVDKLAKGEHAVKDTRNDFKTEKWGSPIKLPNSVNLNADDMKDGATNVKEC